ncbi:hypothetical protein AURDEDRAFT_157292 [Auricularia subglabra TFB-10046 SS5]|nr:hypothetical protein AURDEDRAFT_157292 [Auricularia subglabra TFB-10046 SS5]
MSNPAPKYIVEKQGPYFGMEGTQIVGQSDVRGGVTYLRLEFENGKIEFFIIGDLKLVPAKGK